MPRLDPDRLFPLEARARDLARALYGAVADLPIVSPHGHCDPAWFAGNDRFPDPARLFVTPDHYVFRMLFSQGVPFDALGVPRADGGAVETDGRAIWRVFAANYHLLRATPPAMWIDHALEHVFGWTPPLVAATADACYDHLSDCLAQDGFRPRALFDRFGVETLATTDSALDPLEAHAAIRASDWGGHVIPTYRPDAVVDPDHEGFARNVDALGAMTGEDVSSWRSYLAAHRARRAEFVAMGARASDHGHPTARTEDLPEAEAAALYDRVRAGQASAKEAETFRGQMLTEMARMSLEDGLVMQIHAGAARNHSAAMLASHGRDMGFDIPTRTDYVTALRPLLSAHGTDPRLRVIVFTLDETAYSRELAPLAGVYPALLLGPAWWFFDSPEGMRRYREAVTETAGFYNTAGFNDDTRAFCSIPARHDVARRVDCAYLATLVATGRLAEADAHEVAQDLAYNLAKRAYRLDRA
ncbi:glucuronate isomerase [Jannaschia ovalis]|uniref:Uronate isomerase n=1 Tax=Jannaschia ovalis TaxID=3038773 RepID=A0ABY8L779_9RHOB|nr:glucuronate isomerase [Jannaschia sp. GRR-S6-38]WGH77231.1 glucuronate isomerase [Jannaschia sp. GRR-S6-38]